jgi:hypothetical protein
MKHVVLVDLNETLWTSESGSHNVWLSAAEDH